ncbi:histidine kinase [Faecalicatena contorta]|uniref:sensor histidine kinase n=1 Tax=Faecalicatena contorta TaxID=39482 RepID=UPI00174C7A67|nr:histidine kinase [Faecalicatena contorta]MBM6685688.1 histidine kinase [Faecalicatena contorta]HIX99492.1 histidine kinase [Candidatus Dorea intestinigallinarum]
MEGSQSKSIRVKLVEIFLIVSVTVFVIVIFIYYNLNRTIREMDTVYNSNIQFNDLSENVGEIQNSLYQYLSTKSSDSLEDYYRYSQDYQELLDGLNNQVSGDPVKLAEKNIYYLSQTYLEVADEAVDRKRGRDAAGVRESYQETEEIYGYIQANISSVNTSTFVSNAKNYSTLRVILSYTTGFSICVLFGVMAIAVGWIIMMTRSITKPLIELAGVATEIAQGNMDVDFPIVETGDEVTAVAKACNKMIGSIRNYIEETKRNYERENELVANELRMKNDLKEAQLKYLQAQINPHFLFNSLNAGAQLAMMEGAEKACMFIQNMADFFRYNVRKMQKDVTLREELQLVDSYIYILNVRFAGDIHYSRQIDERLLDISMPSMILQPIIENAVNHGIREMEGEGVIHLSVFGNEAEVCIEITDNGVGIEPETAAKVMRGESVHSMSGRDSEGIGLDNVINRLRSYYGRQHVFEIRRREEGGTAVTLYIPKKGEELEDDENTDL